MRLTKVSHVSHGNRLSERSVRGTVGLRLGWAAGTSRSYAIPPSRALRLAATPWPPSPDRLESPRRAKSRGEAVSMAAVSSSSLDPRSDSLLHSGYRQPPLQHPVRCRQHTALPSATVSRAPAVLARPAASSAHRNHPAHTTSSQQPVSNTMRGGKRYWRREGGYLCASEGGAGCGQRLCRDLNLCDQTHPSSAINSSIRRQRVIF